MRHASSLFCIMLCAIVATLSACGQTTASHRQAIYSEHRSGMMPTVTPSAASLQNIPARLIIPAIHVDASVEPVGVSSNGDLETPAQNPWTATGWYNSGSVPGEHGSAVIDGHLDRPGGFPAVFWNLHLIQVGNRIEVVMASGKIVRFQVTRTAFYPPQAAPLQDIFGNGGGSYLNLITCAGSWIYAQHQTTLRMVVYTSLITNH